MADLSQSFPDAGHEAIRRELLTAVADLGVSLDGIDLLVLLVDDLLTALDESLAQRGQLAADLAALTERVAALENPPEVL